MVVGNLFALRQQNIKRFLAFSSIAQVGFILLGISSHSMEGTSSVVYFVLIYVFSNLAAFGVAGAISQTAGKERIEDYKGLYQTNPLISWVLALSLFSLAGIPPMVGFAGKLSVLQALLASGQTGAVALAVYAVMMSLLAAFYYLRVVKVMYFDAPITASTVSAGTDVRIVLLINSGLLLVLGLLPGGLMTLCARAIVSTLGT
jgi:NADH-quinone oxidoreductase subunit N